VLICEWQKVNSWGVDRQLDTGRLAIVPSGGDSEEGLSLNILKSIFNTYGLMYAHIVDLFPTDFEFDIRKVPIS
jgi:hypothetical protein